MIYTLLHTSMPIDWEYTNRFFRCQKNFDAKSELYANNSMFWMLKNAFFWADVKFIVVIKSDSLSAVGL